MSVPPPPPPPRPSNMPSKMGGITARSGRPSLGIYSQYVTQSARPVNAAPPAPAPAAMNNTPFPLTQPLTTPSGVSHVQTSSPDLAAAAAAAPGPPPSHPHSQEDMTRPSHMSILSHAPNVSPHVSTNTTTTSTPPLIQSMPHTQPPPPQRHPQLASPYGGGTANHMKGISTARGASHPAQLEPDSYRQLTARAPHPGQIAALSFSSSSAWGAPYPEATRHPGASNTSSSSRQRHSPSMSETDHHSVPSYPPHANANHVSNNAPHHPPHDSQPQSLADMDGGREKSFRNGEGSAARHERIAQTRHQLLLRRSVPAFLQPTPLTTPGHQGQADRSVSARSLPGTPTHARLASVPREGSGSTRRDGLLEEALQRRGASAHTGRTGRGMARSPMHVGGAYGTRDATPAEQPPMHHEKGHAAQAALPSTDDMMHMAHAAASHAAGGEAAAAAAAHSHTAPASPWNAVSRRIDVTWRAREADAHTGAAATKPLSARASPDAMSRDGHGSHMDEDASNPMAHSTGSRSSNNNHHYNHTTHDYNHHPWQEEESQVQASRRSSVVVESEMPVSSRNPFLDDDDAAAREVVGGATRTVQHADDPLRRRLSRTNTPRPRGGGGDNDEYDSVVPSSVAPLQLVTKDANHPASPYEQRPHKTSRDDTLAQTRCVQDSHTERADSIIHTNTHTQPRSPTQQHPSLTTTRRNDTEATTMTVNMPKALWLQDNRHRPRAQEESHSGQTCRHNTAEGVANMTRAAAAAAAAVPPPPYSRHEGRGVSLHHMESSPAPAPPLDDGEADVFAMDEEQTHTADYPVRQDDRQHHHNSHTHFTMTGNRGMEESEREGVWPSSSRAEAQKWDSWRANAHESAAPAVRHRKQETKKNNNTEETETGWHTISKEDVHAMRAAGVVNHRTGKDARDWPAVVGTKETEEDVSCPLTPHRAASATMTRRATEEDRRPHEWSDSLQHEAVAAPPREPPLLPDDMTDGREERRHRPRRASLQQQQQQQQQWLELQEMQQQLQRQQQQLLEKQQELQRRLEQQSPSLTRPRSPPKEEEEAAMPAAQTGRLVAASPHTHTELPTSPPSLSGSRVGYAKETYPADIHRAEHNVLNADGRPSSGPHHYDDHHHHPVHTHRDTPSPHRVGQAHDDTPAHEGMGQNAGQETSWQPMHTGTCTSSTSVAPHVPHMTERIDTHLSHSGLHTTSEADTHTRHPHPMNRSEGAAMHRAERGEGASAHVLPTGVGRDSRAVSPTRPPPSSPATPPSVLHTDTHPPYLTTSPPHNAHEGLRGEASSSLSSFGMHETNHMPAAHDDEGRPLTPRAADVAATLRRDSPMTESTRTVTTHPPLGALDSSAPPPTTTRTTIQTADTAPAAPTPRPPRRRDSLNEPHAAPPLAHGALPCFALFHPHGHGMTLLFVRPPSSALSQSHRAMRDSVVVRVSTVDALTASGTVVDSTWMKSREAGHRHVASLRALSRLPVLQTGWSAAHTTAAGEEGEGKESMPVHAGVSAVDYVRGGPGFVCRATAMAALNLLTGQLPAALVGLLSLMLADALPEKDGGGVNGDEEEESGRHSRTAAHATSVGHVHRFDWSHGGRQTILSLLLSSNEGDRRTAPTRVHEVDAAARANENAVEEAGRVVGGGLREVEELICQGRREEAVTAALAHRLYAHAILIGMMCRSQEPYLRAVRAIVEQQLQPSQPLAHAYCLFNDMPPPPFVATEAKEEEEEGEVSAQGSAYTPKKEEDDDKAEDETTEMRKRDEVGAAGAVLPALTSRAAVSRLRRNWHEHAATLVANFTRRSVPALLELAAVLQSAGLVMEAHVCLLIVHLSPLGTPPQVDTDVSAADTRAEGAPPSTQPADHRGWNDRRLTGMTDAHSPPTPPTVSAAPDTMPTHTTPQPLSSLEAERRRVYDTLQRELGMLGAFYHPRDSCRARFLSPTTTLLTQLLQEVRRALAQRESAVHRALPHTDSSAAPPHPSPLLLLSATSLSRRLSPVRGLPAWTPHYILAFLFMQYMWLTEAGMREEGWAAQRSVAAAARSILDEVAAAAPSHAMGFMSEAVSATQPDSPTRPRTLAVLLLRLMHTPWSLSTHPRNANPTTVPPPQPQPQPQPQPVARNSPREPVQTVQTAPPPPPRPESMPSMQSPPPPPFRPDASATQTPTRTHEPMHEQHIMAHPHTKGKEDTPSLTHDRANDAVRPMPTLSPPAAHTDAVEAATNTRHADTLESTASSSLDESAMSAPNMQKGPAAAAAGDAAMRERALAPPTATAHSAAAPRPARSRSIDALMRLFKRGGREEAGSRRRGATATAAGGETTALAGETGEETVAKPMILDTAQPPQFDKATGRWLFEETAEEKAAAELIRRGPPKMPAGRRRLDGGEPKPEDRVRQEEPTTNARSSSRGGDGVSGGGGGGGGDSPTRVAGSRASILSGGPPRRGAAVRRQLARPTRPQYVDMFNSSV